MRQPLTLRQLLSSCLGASLALGSVPLPALAGIATPCHIGTASYDPTYQVLALPLTGPAPHAVVRRLAARQYAIDLPHSLLAKSEVQCQRTSGLLAGWSLDETPYGDTVRLRLTLTRDVEPRLHFEATGSMLRVVLAAGAPLPAARLAAKPAPRVVPAAAPVRLAHAGETWPVRPHHGVKLAAPKPVLRVAAKPAAAKPIVRIAVKPAAPKPVARIAAKPAAPKPVIHVASVVRKAPAHPLSLAAKPASRVLVAGQRTYPLQLAARALPPATVLDLPSAGKAHAALGAARYDAKRNLLVIPFTGTLDPSRLSVERLNKRWAFLDVPSSHPSFAGVRFQERSDKRFQRWVMAKRPARETTRVAFALGADAQFDVKLSGHELLVAVRAPDAEAVASKPVARVAAKVASKAAVLAAAPVAIDAPRLGQPYFDQKRYGLVIPFTGKTPVYRFDEQSPDRAVLEVAGVSDASYRRLFYAYRSHPLMVRWQADRDAANGTVRLALRFRRASDVVVAADPSHHQLLVFPQPRLAAAPTPAAPTTTFLSANLPAGSRQLIIPFDGPTPVYTLETLGASFAYIDFPGAKLQANAVQFFPRDLRSSLNYWLLSERPGQGGVRLALALGGARGAAVYQDTANRRLVIELGDENPIIDTDAGEIHAPAAWPNERPATTFDPRQEPVKGYRKAA